MKTIYIHIGPHKTGTTSLQYFLHERRKSLLSEGVLFPECRLQSWKSQHRLAFSLRNMIDHRNGDVPDREREFRAVLRTIETSGASKIILSAEDFFAVKIESIRYMRDVFCDFDVRVIFYARRQDETFVSSFSQKTKTPRSAFIEPLHPFLDKPDRLSPDFDLYARVSNWASVFGKESMVPCLYAKANDIRADFLNRVGGEKLAHGALKARSHYINTKPSLETLEYIRAYKSHEPDIEKRRQALRALTRHFAGRGHPATDLLSTTDRRRILEHYRQGNDRLFAEYFGTENMFDPDTLLTDAPTERVHVDTSDAVRLVEQLIVEQTAEAQPAIMIGSILRSLRKMLPVPFLRG